MTADVQLGSLNVMAKSLWMKVSSDWRYASSRRSNQTRHLISSPQIRYPAVRVGVFRWMFGKDPVDCRCRKDDKLGLASWRDWIESRGR